VFSCPNQGYREVLGDLQCNCPVLAPIGFQRVKSAFFIRRHEWTIQFIHLHKCFSAPSYRIHLGIRVLNDVFPALALNGPDSDPYTGSADSPNGSRYVLEISTGQRTVEGCAAEIHRWCADVGSLWFDRYSDPHSLLVDSDSPLRENEKTRLRRAMAGDSDPAAVRASESLLGIAERRRASSAKETRVTGSHSTAAHSRKHLRGPRIRDLERRIEELEKRLQMLENL
jgi:hypothetical protein